MDSRCLWVQSLNRIEAHHAETVPDDKLTWTASEGLAMVREAIGTNHKYNALLKPLEGRGSDYDTR